MEQNKDDIIKKALISIWFPVHIVRSQLNKNTNYLNNNLPKYIKKIMKKSYCNTFHGNTDERQMKQY